jgi:hypothetical protein
VADYKALRSFPAFPACIRIRKVTGIRTRRGPLPEQLGVRGIVSKPFDPLTFGKKIREMPAWE